MEIQDLLKNIWRKRWILILAVITGVCFTALFLQFKSDQFTSSARISTGFTLDDKISLSEENRNNNRSGETKFSNLLALMKSPTSYNLLSYNLLLHDLKAINGFSTPKDVSSELEQDKFKKILMLVKNKINSFHREETVNIHDLYTDAQVNRVINILEYKLENREPLYSNEPDFELIRRFLLSYGYDFKRIKDALTMQRVRDTDYIEVSFTSGNKYLSAFAANTYCEEFIDYYASVKGENSSESTIILKDIVRQKKDSLESKLEVLSRYKTSEIPDANHANATRYDQLIELESKRDEIETRIKEIELTFIRLQEDLSSTGQVNSSNQEIVTLQQKLKELNSRYINSGSNNKALADSLKFLRTQLKNTISQINRQEEYPSQAADIRGKIKDANIDHEVEKNKLNQVNQRIANIRYGLSNNRSAEDQISRLENEINVARQEYQQVLNKYNEAKNLQVALNPLKQILKATPAISPTSMPDIFILLISAASCFGFGLFAVILLTITDERIKNSSRFKSMVDLPLISVVNELKLGHQSLPNPRKIFKAKKNNWQIEFYKSAVRHLRFQIEAADNQVVLFTSLRNKVGKSSIVCSLAYTLSLLNKRVLIIDTNFKSNTLTRIFGVGLKEIKVVNPRMVVPKVQPVNAVMENGSSGHQRKPERPLSSMDMVNMTQYENIFFIGNSGVKGMSPMELLSKADFKQFIQMMSERFDYIFMEGPALNDYADAKELTEFAQKVITVVSANSEIDPIDEESLNFIKNLNGKAGGAVLNRVAPADIKD